MAVKIGPPGEFASADDIAWSAQQIFLQAMQRVHPEPIRLLRDDIYPAYANWIKTATAAAGEGRPSSAQPALNSFIELENKAPKLAQRIKDWADRFHLIGEIEPEPDLHGEQCTR